MIDNFKISILNSSIIILSFFLLRKKLKGSNFFDVGFGYALFSVLLTYLIQKLLATATNSLGLQLNNYYISIPTLSNCIYLIISALIANIIKRKNTICRPLPFLMFYFLTAITLFLFEVVTFHHIDTKTNLYPLSSGGILITYLCNITSLGLIGNLSLIKSNNRL